MESNCPARCKSRYEDQWECGTVKRVDERFTVLRPAQRPRRRSSLAGGGHEYCEGRAGAAGCKNNL